MKTYWSFLIKAKLKFDTIASRIGQSAQMQTIFMKPLSYNSKKVYDDEILYILDKALKENISNSN